MNLEERVREWCESHNKSMYYGDDMTSQKLDELNFPKRKLSLKWTNRSQDVFLGAPFNIASYGLLLLLLSKEVNMIADNLIMSVGDCHIYLNHVEQCKEQLKRETFKLPSILLNNNSIFDLKYEDIKLINYISSPPIKGEISN
jgi:thymidylate synthase